MKSKIDYNRPTAMMLGRWQPWHQGHQELFKKALEKTGQVIIMIRSMPSSKDNPFDVKKVEENIKEALASYHGFYEIGVVPNITNICYGRGVGYKIEKIELPKEIQKISATKIRKEINEI
jgi:cytidyltransferase-like protein|tara:strand:+ start:1150 stop:1509 length:360 start_codon:yes stop_codon:yes gene_type:complete